MVATVANTKSVLPDMFAASSEYCPRQEHGEYQTEPHSYSRNGPLLRLCYSTRAYSSPLRAYRRLLTGIPYAP